MPARGWGRDGRRTETYVDGDDVECVPPLRACSRCDADTRDTSPLPLCGKCRPDHQWRLK
jgi:hypothetical protein